jgi:hypothetical protein
VPTRVSADKPPPRFRYASSVVVAVSISAASLASTCARSKFHTGSVFPSGSMPPAFAAGFKPFTNTRGPA